MISTVDNDMEPDSTEIIEEENEFLLQQKPLIANKSCIDYKHVRSR